MTDFTIKMASCFVFSKVSLRKGYHQIPVNTSDVQKMVITTPFGMFEYLRMPFGLQNAGNTFQRMMGRVLEGVDFCFWYLDDVVIVSPSYELHLEHLRQLFQRMQDHGQVINLEKCLRYPAGTCLIQSFNLRGEGGTPQSFPLGG
jgi:hypothetical protein